MKFLVDSSGWKLRDYRNFLTAAKSNEFDPVLESMTKIVKINGEFRDFEWLLDNLNLKDWQALTAEVQAVLTKEFEPKK
jgi:hypothetical protein